MGKRSQDQPGNSPAKESQSVIRGNLLLSTLSRRRPALQQAAVGAILDYSRFGKGCVHCFARGAFLSLYHMCHYSRMHMASTGANFDSCGTRVIRHQWKLYILTLCPPDREEDHPTSTLLGPKSHVRWGASMYSHDNQAPKCSCIQRAQCRRSFIPTPSPPLSCLSTARTRLALTRAWVSRCRSVQ